jgi:hypothetical protein
VSNSRAIIPGTVTIRSLRDYLISDLADSAAKHERTMTMTMPTDPAAMADVARLRNQLAAKREKEIDRLTQERAAFAAELIGALRLDREAMDKSETPIGNQIVDAVARLTEELDSSDGCLNMIAERLEALGCQHEGSSHESTPPMMYDDWIRCCVAKREKEIARLTAQVEAGKLCHDWLAELRKAHPDYVIAPVKAGGVPDNCKFESTLILNAGDLRRLSDALAAWDAANLPANS